MSAEPLALASRPLRSLASVHLRSLTLNPAAGLRRSSSSSSSSTDTLRNKHQHGPLPPASQPKCVCVLSRDAEVLWASPSTSLTADQDLFMHFDSNEHVARRPGLYGGSAMSLDLWVWRGPEEGKGKQRAGDDDEPWMLLLRYDVHLDHLIPLGSTPSTFPSFPPNSLVLQFSDHKDFWLVPSQQRHQPHSSPQHRQVGERARRVSAATPDDLFALLSLEQLLASTRNQVHEEHSPQGRWLVWERLRAVRQASEDVRELKRFISETKEANRHLTEEVQHRRDQQAQRRSRLQAAHQRLSLSKERLQSTRTDTSRLQSELSFTRTALGDIRATHLAALEFIFDIQPTSAALLFSLFGGSLPLPNSEGLTEDHASALGVTALLVNLLAAFLGVGLNYPLLFSGSRSLAVDPISLIKGPRSFPLYAYGVEDYRFHYAVFLLNKDVEQLCLSENVLCTDLRQTLPNLTNLILTVTGRSKAPRGRKAINVDSSSGWRREGCEGSLREAITSPTTPRGIDTNGSRSTSPASTVRGHPRTKGADSPTPSEKIRLVTKPSSTRSSATATDKERPLPSSRQSTAATHRT